MAINHIQEGKVLDWVNDSGAEVKSGSMVAVGARVGISLNDIAQDHEGRLAMAEVWEVPKKASAIAVGDELYLDAAEGKLCKTSVDNIKAGYAFADAETSAETVAVKLNG